MKRYSLLLVILITLLASCRRDLHEPFFGPKACPNEDFAIITPFTAKQSANASNVLGILNFSLKELPLKKKFVDSLTINAKFNAAAVWRVEITGQSSLAKKIYTAESDEINVVWYGRPTGDKFFMDEKIEIVFSVQCRPDLTQKVILNLISGDFTNDPKFFLIENFDKKLNPLIYKNAELDSVNGDGVIDTAYFPVTKKNWPTKMTTSPQGGNFLSCFGISPVPFGPSKNTYGSIDFENYTFSGKKGYDTKDIWLNFYASSGTTNPTKIVISYIDDKKNKIKQGSYTLTPSTEWKNYSFNLGNAEIFNPNFDKTNYITVIIAVVQSGGVAPTEFDIDFVNFTYREPFWGNEK